MRRLILLISLISTIAQAQVLKTTKVSTFASAGLEPDERRLTLKINAGDFILLSKTKGGVSGESTYQIEKFSKDLSEGYKTPIVCKADEEPKELFTNGTHVILFTVTHSDALKKAILKAYSYDIYTGALASEKILDEQDIKPWAESLEKGAVKEHFYNAIGCNLIKNSISPLQYQYEIRFSPDNSKILFYLFDYSQNHMMARAQVLDKNLNVLTKGAVPIDNEFVNYGLYPNNKGEVYILNVDQRGRIVVIRYNMQTRDNTLLDIQSTTHSRSSVHLIVWKDDQVYIASTNTKNNALIGVVYAKLNFKTLLVEKINFHMISEGVIQTAQTLRPSFKHLSGQENWYNYEISDFMVNPYEKVTIILEKREIIIPAVAYDAHRKNNIKNWIERSCKVNTEGIILISFNKNEELLWENFYLKSQVNDIGMGMLSSSYSVYVTDEGKIRMVFNSYDTPGIYNTINYVEWDELTGMKTKEFKLPNPEGLAYLRGYTVWWENQVVTLGRKGLLGKKTSLSLYELQQKAGN